MAPSETSNRGKRYKENPIKVPKLLLIAGVSDALKDLLHREDTNEDQLITIDDHGPKVISLPTLDSNGYRRHHLSGNYAVSNLLQELTLRAEDGHKVAVISTSILCESPLHRIRRQIRDRFWDGLTRRLDADVIEQVIKDSKVVSRSGIPTIYVPRAAHAQLIYYSKVAEQLLELKLQVVEMPRHITTETYRSMLASPGILALDTHTYLDEGGHLQTVVVPFVVPSSRFNEFFGWDSYFMGIGLLADNRTDLPPFLTDLAIRFYKATKHQNPHDAQAFLKVCIEAAIKEYNEVWTSLPRLDPASGLSKYHADGVGIPIEVEPGHFDTVLMPFALKHGISIDEFIERFNDGEIDEPELEEYLQHDRGVRESGHDTSSRLEGRASNLLITDLNFCLYKYEKDIAWALRYLFDDNLDSVPSSSLSSSPSDSSSSSWEDRAAKRQVAVNKYLWNKDQGTYYDYDVKKEKQISSESVTCLWALCCGVASENQAAMLVSSALPKFEYRGGLAASSPSTNTETMAHGHQWDYPSGWAPHQMLAWDGLSRYGYTEEASRLAYRWLYNLLTVFVDYNGMLCEKYDVTRVRGQHQVTVEYGNQGADFSGVPREGFGWTNASLVHGLSFLSDYMQKALNVCSPYESLKCFKRRVTTGQDAELVKEYRLSKIAKQ
ncbi:trehalase-domain-containing protein [Hypoxylon argillaceum]|nr:trehalase-domain-containing protein [Hypoxylon argillaceum]